MAGIVSFQVLDLAKPGDFQLVERCCGVEGTLIGPFDPFEGMPTGSIRGIAV